jgi:hypothetical protein
MTATMTMPDEPESLNGHHSRQRIHDTTTATRYLCAAAHLRRSMMPEKITEPGILRERKPYPVGRAYCLAVLGGFTYPRRYFRTPDRPHALWIRHGKKQATLMPGVDVDRVQLHCLVALLQTMLRDSLAVLTLISAVMLDPWGTLISIGLIAAVVAFTGRIRITSPLVIGAGLGLTLALLSSWPHGSDPFTVPLVALAICFLAYVIDGMLARLLLRNVLRQEPAAQGSEISSMTEPQSVLTSPAVNSATDFLPSGGTGSVNLNGQERSAGKIGYVYYEKNRILGAGNPLPTARLTVPVDKPIDQEIRFFRASELLDYIERHLRSQGEADGQRHGFAYPPISLNTVDGEFTRQAVPLTYGLPALEVDQVLAVPAADIKKMPLLPVLIRDLDDGANRSVSHPQAIDTSPSQHPSRHYVRARTTAWDGQLVISLYVSAALQGHYLRLTLRPYMVMPIAPDLRVGDAVRDTSWLALLVQSLTETSHRLLDIAVSAHYIGRHKDDDDISRPTSPNILTARERYAEAVTTNMHHIEDAERTVEIMQMKVSKVAEAFLKKHGIDTSEFDRQVQIMIQNIQNSLVAGGDVSLNNSDFRPGNANNNTNPGGGGDGTKPGGK